MTLPEIVLPKITLPFDIAVLLHPSVVHFLIALPVVILLLELMNLMMKKKAVGGVSFFLLLLVVGAAIGAYFTGLTDGKEAYPALNEIAKSSLAEHKLLGTYLLLASVVVLMLKLFAMTGVKVFKALYLLVLIAFVIVMFKQGKEGGELVYTHGLNVQAVKALDDKIFDLEESLEEMTEKEKTVSLKVQQRENVASPEEVKPIKAIEPAVEEVEPAPVREEAQPKALPREVPVVKPTVSTVEITAPSDTLVTP